MKKTFIIFFAIIIAHFSFAQKNQIKHNFKRFSFDVYSGLPIIYGDIDNKMAGYEATGRLNWNMTRAFAIGGEYSIGMVKGQNNKYDQEYFTNKYMKAAIGFEVFFFNFAKFSDLTSWFQPYFGINGGMIKSDIEHSGDINGVFANHFNDWVFMHEYHAGLKFKVAKFLDINARYNLAYIKSDMFDNWDPDFNVNKYNDFLTSATLGFTFHIGKKDKPVTYWTSTDISKDLLDEKADKNTQDSLAQEIENLKNALKDATQDVVDQANTNNNQQIALDSLHNKLGQLNDCCKNNTQVKTGNESPYNDIQLLETELTGPIQATYYVIVGSFMVQENADRRVEEVKAKGYQPFIMIESKTGLKRVAIDYTDDAEEAFAKAAKYRIEIDPTTWIIKNVKGK